MPTIEFLEDVHQYIVDGVCVPAVSDLIRLEYPDAYEGVPKRILKKKADYGTKVHHMIESYIAGEITLEEIEAKRIDPDIKIAVEQFIEIQDKWAFIIKDMEQVVTYGGIYAGTYDLRTVDDYIIDLKTTTKLHEDWLKLQISLYYLGAGLDKPYGYCIWIPKGKLAQVIKIDCIPRDELLKMIDGYKAKATE